jgi:hypothetical protein
MTPLSNKPKITPLDLARGEVMRYFVRHVATGKVTEIDSNQFESFSSNPLYERAKFAWIITGLSEDSRAINGKPIYGTRHKNTITTEFYNKRLPGLRGILRNPLEFFVGRRNSPPAPQLTSTPAVSTITITPPEPSVPAPPPEPVEPTFERLTLGRLAAHARTDELVSGVNTAFVVGDWAGFSSTAATVTPSITTDANPGELQVALGATADTARRGVRYTALETGRDVFLIVRTRTVAFNVGLGGVVARLPDSGANEMLVGRRGYVNSAANSNFALVETFAASSLQFTAAANSDERAPGVVGLWVRDTLANGRSVGLNRDDSLSLTGLSSSLEGTYCGIFANRVDGSNTLRFTAWAAMLSAIIRVEGPNSGTWVVRLRDSGGTLIYTSASHTAGVVAINTLTEMTVLYPLGMSAMAQIEIYDPIAEEVLMGPVIPEERLWGGDVWQYNVGT